MKRLLLWILIGLICVSSVSAWEWDNVKDYDEETKTITVTNALGLGDVIGTHTLIYNTKSCMNPCYAGGTSVLYEETELFRELNFKDTEEKETTIRRSEIEIEKKRNVTIEVQDYKEVCVENISIGGQSCNKVKSGTHEEVVEETYWEEYNFETLKEGTYNWKITGFKDINQRVDWIVSDGFGEDLTEWAWWGFGSNWIRRKCTEIDFNYSKSGNLFQENLTAITLATNNCSEVAVVDGDGVSNYQVNRKVIYDTGKALGDGNEECGIAHAVNHSGTNVTYCYYYDNAGATEIWEQEPQVWSNRSFYYDEQNYTSHTIDDLQKFDIEGNAKLVEHSTSQSNWATCTDDGLFATSENFTIEMHVNCSNDKTYIIQSFNNDERFCGFGFNSTAIGINPSIAGCGTSNDMTVNVYTTNFATTPRTIRMVFSEVASERYRAWVDPYDTDSTIDVLPADGEREDGYEGFTRTQFGTFGVNHACTIAYIIIENGVIEPPVSSTLGAEEVGNTAPTIDTPTITPTTPTYLSTLNCSTTPYDNELDTLSVNFSWYNGTVIYESTLVSGVSHGNLTSDTLTAGVHYDAEVWNCTVFANDGTVDSLLNSTNISIQSRPTHSIPDLNSTNSTLNDTYQNLTCFNQSTADVDGDTVKNIYNWYKDDVPLMVIYFPFETNGSEDTNPRDYSGNRWMARFFFY